ncbi:winged helix-turn-helix transcriptional regulator [Agaribacter marinus]|uniref:Transcriptional regulator n=1 Tax=Agaribacter marinus TaxID=1431249 RepID=A0AA37T7M5_9ALTE|nr:helix-turn-helix domain-containing protein [Agaribacter marinus]GLR72970.1 transcriptional regulator [Agaribacter marinus]
MKNDRQSICFINCAIEAYGDRWSLIIIRDMAFYEKRTFGEFLKSPEGISTNILANRLLHLESSGLIDKRKCSDDGRAYIYSLTNKGESVKPILEKMMVWGKESSLNKYNEHKSITVKHKD